MRAKTINRRKHSPAMGQSCAMDRIMVAVSILFSAAMMCSFKADAAIPFERQVNLAVWSNDAVASGPDKFSIKDNYWSIGHGRSSGVRFENILLPQAAEITSAYLIFDSPSAYRKTPVNTLLRGQASDNASTFSDRADYDSRPRTSANVVWDDISGWERGSIHKSLDISSVIQEIVNRPGWNPGNALVLFCDDHDSGDGCSRSAYSKYNRGRAAVLHIEYEHTKPSVLGSLGKKSDGWSGVIPVYMDTHGGLIAADYPHARAQILTPAGETYYTPMTWNHKAERFEGTINIGSWYGHGCADPNLGAYAVTVQLDNQSDFSSIDYHNRLGTTFSTFATQRKPGIPARVHCHDTEFMPTWNVDHWDYRIHDFSVSTPWGGPRMQFNVAVAIPFYPTTARITNMAVTFDGVSVPPGNAASTNDCWWWDDATHALYVQKASIPKGGRYTVALDFDSDTDLFATRIDYYTNCGNGTIGAAHNGLMIANRYIQTPIAGGDHELSGCQVSTHARDMVSENDINIDCAERVAVPVDGIMLADGSKKYPLHLKWKQNEWKDYIVREDNDSIVVRVHSDDTPVTGWAPQLTNNIAVQRTQTYYAGKRYIKNVYTLTNQDKKPHTFPFIWGREQYIGIDNLHNDKGRYAGDTSDRITECKVDIASLPAPWFTAYDAKVMAALGVIFQKDDPADNGYFLYHTPLKDIKEFPLTVSTSRANSTQNTCTFFDKVYESVAPGASVTFTFWMWGGDFSSWAEIEAAIDSDARELNGLAGVDIDPQDKDGQTPLMIAVEEGRLDKVKRLLAKGADVNARDKNGTTVLMRAADKDYLDDGAREMIDFLLAKGADINARDKDGNTPLMRSAATAKGQLEMVEFLADKGADVDVKDRYGYTPLMKGTPAVVTMLAEKGADLNVRDPEGKTLLMKAARNKVPLEILKTLLDNGADLEMRDPQGKTTLMIAADRMSVWAWKLAVVKILADKGANVDTRDKDGKTPLMKAVARGQLELVTVLVDKGADVNAKDKAGKTPLMSATGKTHNDVIDLLKQHGTNKTGDVH